MWCFFFRIRLTPRSTRTYTLFPYTTLFRSSVYPEARVDVGDMKVRLHKSPSTMPDLVKLVGSAGIPSKSSKKKAVTQSSKAASSRSEEHTSELQSLMRISYAVFCLKKKKYTEGRNRDDRHTTLNNE